MSGVIPVNNIYTLAIWEVTALFSTRIIVANFDIRQSVLKKKNSLLAV